MSYWIEVHCDVRSEVENPAISLIDNRACFNNGNEYPSLMAVQGEHAWKMVMKEATERGWVRRLITEPSGYRFRGWVCPHCQRFPPA